jgi:hypothetical protein
MVCQSRETVSAGFFHAPAGGNYSGGNIVPEETCGLGTVEEIGIIQGVSGAQSLFI